eukprot:scaffold5891_cov121-Isochrysis_galbana.AAC.5
MSGACASSARSWFTTTAPLLNPKAIRGAAAEGGGTCSVAAARATASKTSAKWEDAVRCPPSYPRAGSPEAVVCGNSCEKSAWWPEKPAGSTTSSAVAAATPARSSRPKRAPSSPSECGWLPFAPARHGHSWNGTPSPGKATTSSAAGAARGRAYSAMVAPI